MSGSRQMKLLELHLVHDPDKGEVAVELLAAAGEERFRYTIRGRYSNADDQPTATLNVEHPTVDVSLDGWRRILPFGPALAGVGLDCHRLEVLEMKRERVPAATQQPKCTCPLVDTSVLGGPPSFRRGDPAGCKVHGQKRDAEIEAAKRAARGDIPSSGE